MMKKLFLYTKLVIFLCVINCAFTQSNEQLMNKENPLLDVLETEYHPLQAREELIFYLPNTFTPNTDVFNEVFLPVFASSYAPDVYTLYIFNRWGELLFESHDVSTGWDGKRGDDGINYQDGVYIWKIVYKQKMDSQQIVMLGHVNLVR
jgi:gliding motility-associated-like protein